MLLLIVDERDMHPHRRVFTQTRFSETLKSEQAEKTKLYWAANAQRTIREKLLHPSYNTGRKKLSKSELVINFLC